MQDRRAVRRTVVALAALAALTWLAWLGAAAAAGRFATSTDLYQRTLAAARSEPRAAELLGEPLEGGSDVDLQAWHGEEGSRGRVTTTLRGPRGAGTLRARAEREGGDGDDDGDGRDDADPDAPWRIVELELEVDGRVYVLRGAGAAGEG